MNEYEEFRNSKIIKCAEVEMKKCKHPYVGTEHLLLALLKLDEIKCICSKYNLTYENFRKTLMNLVGSSTMESDFILHTPLLKMVVVDAIDEAGGQLDSKYLLLSLLENGDGIAVRILMSMNIKIDKLYGELRKSIKVFKELDFGINLNEVIDLNERVTGRDKEIDLMIQTLLRKNKSNPILVGAAGVGKTAIVEELARRIKLGLVPSKLQNKTIISLEMFSLVAGTKYRGEFEEKIKKLLDSVIDDGNIILFIDEIHTVVHAGGSEGAIDAANILKPYLSRGDLSVIGATTVYEYNKYIKKDKALERRFQLINILEPSIIETIDILNKSKRVYEKFYDIRITKSNVKDIVYLADKYIKSKKNPDKSFEILDLLCSKICLKEDMKKIKKQDILDIIKDISHISINDEFNLEKLKVMFNEELIGQDDILEKIELVLKEKSDKPASMMFCGSSGVGKTKAASIISKTLGYNFIKLDMTEYISEASINKLIGAPNGYQGSDEEFILDKVRFNPHSVILLDEVEKASRRVLNLFLNILDEGIICDSKGETIDFSHCIIILTSNLKRESSVGFFEKSKNNRFFNDEFVARLDDIIYFNDIDDAMIERYLNRNNSTISVLDIKNNCDYKRLGFRAINRYLNKCEKNKQRV